MGRVLSLVLAMLFTIGATASAQTASGTISGTVHDSTGAVIPGVAVTTRNVATGASRSAVTDAQGRYRIANVEPGEYELRAALTGFRTAVRSSLIVTVGGTTETDLELTVGSVAEEVTVQTEAPLIETSKVDLSRVVSTREIESLPISGRNFVDFVKLSSGVALGRENVGGGAFKEPDVGVGSAAAPRLSFGGQPELNMMIQVDGATMSRRSGLPRATPSQEAAKEFRVLNSTYLRNTAPGAVRQHRHQVRDQSGKRLGVLLLDGRRPGRQVHSQPAQRGYAQPESVRRHVRRTDHRRPDVLLRQLRRSGAEAVQPLLASGARQSGAAQRGACAARAPARDDGSGPRQSLQRFSSRSTIG
jgi:hypothetical protein